VTEERRGSGKDHRHEGIRPVTCRRPCQTH
jgi:hypothetical protein